MYTQHLCCVVGLSTNPCGWPASQVCAALACVLVWQGGHVTVQPGNRVPPPQLFVQASQNACFIPSCARDVDPELHCTYAHVFYFLSGCCYVLCCSRPLEADWAWQSTARLSYSFAFSSSGWQLCSRSSASACWSNCCNMCGLLQQQGAMVDIAWSALSA
jgi:hypothetical protein